MKKLQPCFIVIVVSVFLLLFGSNVFAEPYQNSKFPSTEIIAKAWKSQNAKLPFINLIGKFENQKNDYTLYIQYEMRYVGGSRSPIIGAISLVRLDSNIWIYQGNYILQK